MRSENLNYDVRVEGVKAMFTLYRITFALARKPKPRRLLFKHRSVDFGAITVTERSCTPPISKIGASHIGQILCHTLVQFEKLGIRTVAEALK